VVKQISSEAHQAEGPVQQKVRGMRTGNRSKIARSKNRKVVGKITRHNLKNRGKENGGGSTNDKGKRRLAEEGVLLNWGGGWGLLRGKTETGLKGEQSNQNKGRVIASGQPKKAR